MSSKSEMHAVAVVRRDPRAEEGDAKPTVEIPKAPDWAIGLFERINQKQDAMREDVCGHLHKLDADMQVVRGEVATIAKWRGEMEGWRSTTSERVRETSELTREASSSNLTQDGVLAKIVEDMGKQDEEIAAIKATSSKSFETIDRLEKRATELLKNPKIIMMLIIAYTFVVKWAEKHNLLP